MTASPSTSPLVASAVVPRVDDRCYWQMRRRLLPGLRNSQYAYFEALDRLLRDGDDWLDLGCGRRLTPDWLRGGDAIQRSLVDRAGYVIGVDPDQSALEDNVLGIDLRSGDAAGLPVMAGSVDLVTMNMVAEHLRRPRQAMVEVARVLRPGGRVLIHTPNWWYPLTAAASVMPDRLVSRVAGRLEGRACADIYPAYYRMNRTGKLRRLARRSGLVMDQAMRLPTSPETRTLGRWVVPEMLMIKATTLPGLRGLQSNLIVVLRKPE
ncbi:MAG: methyltransferase domain-containing protein [Planctomycetota bacterium]